MTQSTKSPAPTTKNLLLRPIIWIGLNLTPQGEEDCPFQTIFQKYNVPYLKKFHFCSINPWQAALRPLLIDYRKWAEKK